MAKGKDKDTKKAGAAEHHARATEHHAAKAHGQASTVDTSLPATRSELLALHAEARRRRNEAPLGGKDFQAAINELERIEVRIAAVDRAADPPLG